MKIGIDVKCLSKRYTGIAIYVCEVIRYLNELDTENEYILYSNRKITLPFELNRNWHIVIYNSMLGSFGLRYRLPKFLLRDKVDIFWGTEHFLPIKNSLYKTVVTIHDLYVLQNPSAGTFYNAILQRLYVKKSCCEADRIISISRSTKKDIVSLCNIDKSKISVIYNGDSPYNGLDNSYTNDNFETILSKYSINDKYILFVGTIEPRKNIKTIVKAYSLYRSRTSQSLKLVLAGGLGWKYKDIMKEIELSDYKSDIIFTGYCTSEEKECLYRNAVALIFPSIYEGLGLPIIEAMSVGVPVITSAVSSLPEIGGNIAFYLHNIFDESELSSLIETVVKLDEESREKIKINSIAWAKRFSRYECAKETLELFKDLYKLKRI